MRGAGILFSLATFAIVGAGVYGASRPVEVYGPADTYSVSRPVVPDGEMDRVLLTASVTKLLDCEVERGDGPLWVDFYDGSDPAPPPSAFFRPDGTPAGTTLIRAGESVTLRGYSAVVPYRLRGLDGTFVVRIPCQLWTTGPDGDRVYGRKVVASYGPVVVPPAGQTAVAQGGSVVTTVYSGEASR